MSDFTFLTEEQVFGSNGLDIIKELGVEYVAIFDAIWTHGGEERLERIAEIQMAENISLERVRKK